jgi:group II intron reverse transcriptase/maturase
MWEKIFVRNNLVAALKHVEQNKGAAGSDGMETKELRGFLKSHWPEIRKQLDRGEYKPAPLRRKDIPKPNGDKRHLSIPTVFDRFLQQATLQVLTPQFDTRFSEASFGYRPGKSAHMAVKKAREYIQEGYTWVVDIDLSNFFDHVNHDKLMGRVARVIKDKQVLKLVRSYLNAGVMINGVVMETDKGTPQGGPLSPLLANIMLDDLDKELEKRGHCFVRYADDITIYVKSQRAGERVLLSIRKFIENKLKLKVNEDKSTVDRPHKRKLLSFSFFDKDGNLRILIAKQALTKFRNNLRKLTRRGREGTLTTVIDEINTYTRGWLNYFQLAKTPSVFGTLDGWIRRRLRQMIWKRWKQGTTRFKELVALGIPRDKAALGAYGNSSWRMSISPVVQTALSNVYFEQQGLQSLFACYHRLQRTW